LNPKFAIGLSAIVVRTSGSGNPKGDEAIQAFSATRVVLDCFLSFSRELKASLATTNDVGAKGRAAGTVAEE
jgi:hypothetical protein